MKEILKFIQFMRDVHKKNHCDKPASFDRELLEEDKAGVMGRDLLAHLRGVVGAA